MRVGWVPPIGDACSSIATTMQAPMVSEMFGEACPASAPFFGYMGAAAALIFASACPVLHFLHACRRFGLLLSPTVPSGHFAATESQRGRVGALEAGTDSAASWLAHVAVLREEMWTQAGGGETVIVYARADVGKSSCKQRRASWTALESCVAQQHSNTA